MILYVPGFSAVLYGGLAAVLVASIALILGIGSLGARRRPAPHRPGYRCPEPRRVSLFHSA